jgi:hypothetical protein
MEGVSRLRTERGKHVLIEAKRRQQVWLEVAAKETLEKRGPIRLKLQSNYERGDGIMRSAAAAVQRETGKY